MRIASLLLSLAAACLCLYPLLWMFLSSFKTNREIFQPTNFFPSIFDWSAYRSLLTGEFLPFQKYLINSLLLSSGQAILATSSSLAAGFALAKFRFPGRSVLVGLAILLILIPKQTMVVPTFEWLDRLNLIGSRWSLLLPGAVSGLGVLFFLQIFRNLPNEWMDQARIEGLSPLRAFFLVVPLAMPGVVGFGVLHFVLSWQDHLLPLVVLDDENITLPLALTKLRDASFRIPEAVGMAAACLSLLPVLVLFGLCIGNMKTALREVVQS